VLIVRHQCSPDAEGIDEMEHLLHLRALVEVIFDSGAERLEVFGGSGDASEDLRMDRGGEP
jgi:hypothetical protein